MNPRIVLPIVVVAAGLALAFLLLNARPPVEREESAVPPPLVRVIEARARGLDLVVASQGTVKPRTESELVSQVAGRIVRVSPQFAAGGFFRAGETLVAVDPRDYELAVEQAEARLAQAQARLELEEAEAEIARLEWQELGEGEASPLARREPQLAEARINLRAAKAALEKARLDLERTTIQAPFDGRVRAKRVDVGQFVSPGTPLASVYSTESAEIELPVPRRDLAFLDLDLGAAAGAGPSVTLRSDLGGGETLWSARVVRTGSELDPRSRMLPLYARIDDPFARRAGTGHPPLPMGLFVEAAISGIRVEDVVSLPRSALRPDDTVLVVDGEDRLRSRAVEILRLAGDRALLSSGVDDGELVCLSQIETFVEGMRVRTVRDTDTEPASPAELEDAA